MRTDKEQHFFEQVWSFWTPLGAEAPPCLQKCGRLAVTLHEIDPRSINPEWLDQPFNSVPLCATCHDEAQLDPTSSGIALRALAIERAHAVSDWKGKDYSRMVREIYDER